MNQTPPSVVERLLAERIGLDPSSVGDKLIARGVHVRMAAVGSRSKVEYERILIDQPDELQALIEEIVVSESWFFRDEKPFEVLDRFARDGWLTDLARPPLSALSVPCASGEEPYSIAITLLESGLPAGRFRVDAVDVSGRSVARAIAGVYGRNAFRGSASAKRSGYFREHDGSFTLDLAVRATVRFHLGNILDPTLFANRGPFDVVFCRNLLIYLDDDARARAFESLARLVADGGLLFLGHADRLEMPANSPFEPLAEKGCFAYRKGKPKAIPGSPLARSGSAPPSGSLPPGGGGLGWEVARQHRGRSKPASPEPARRATPPHPGPPPQGGREAEKVAGGVTPPHPNPPPQGGRELEKANVLDLASSLADSGRYEEAKTLLEGVISGGGGDARAYYLLGMLAQASGAREQAERHYLRAIYLDPQHDEALMALAVLARRKGDVAAEAGYRRRAERVLARKVSP